MKTPILIKTDDIVLLNLHFKGTLSGSRNYVIFNSSVTHHYGLSCLSGRYSFIYVFRMSLTMRLWSR